MANCVTFEILTLHQEILKSFGTQSVYSLLTSHTRNVQEIVVTVKAKTFSNAPITIPYFEDIAFDTDKERTK
jgi:shikimate 5-dehydrogenase